MTRIATYAPSFFWKTKKATLYLGYSLGRTNALKMGEAEKMF